VKLCSFSSPVTKRYLELKEIEADDRQLGDASAIRQTVPTQSSSTA